MSKQNEQKLAAAPLGKLMLSLALPSVLAQIINVLYNIVDRMYIGHIPVIGKDALTGLGVCFPVLMIISAFSAFAGAGGAPLAAIQLGKKNKNNAEKILGNSITLILIFSLILTIIFMIFKNSILYMFGASDVTIVYASNYLSVYLLGTIFVQIALGLNMFITCQGKAKTAMISVLIGAVSNIILDPIFIFVFKMHVTGAAIATIISQALSAGWVLKFLFSSQSAIKIKITNMKINFDTLKKISGLGISPFIMQATESAIFIVFNRGLQLYGGDLYVGSMTILQSILQLLVIPIQGFTQGIQPIISYNFGAKNFQRVKQTFFISTTITFIISALGSALAFIFPSVFAKIFTQNEELINLVSKVLPIYISGMFIFGIQMGCQNTFLGLGQAKISLFIALLRKVILLIPLAIILPKFFGVIGIYYSEPISDVISATTAGLLFLFNYKKILSENK